MLTANVLGQWSVNEAYGDELEDIQFVDRLNGYAVGRDNGIGSCGPAISAIFRTADGGETWVRNATDDSYEMTSVHFIDRQKGWASGYFGDTYKTMDCGQTWTRNPTNTGVELQDIYFVNEQIGFTVGENGRVLKSTNGGQSWFFTYFDTQPDFNGIEFYDDQFGLAVASSGRIIRTTNQGQTWEDIDPDEGFNYLDIEFLSATEIIVSGFDIILKSTDAGLTWQTVLSADNLEGIRAVEFTSPQVGYFGSSQGDLRKTWDGGETWTALDFPFDEDIYGIHFIDSDLGYLSGSSGSIFRTTDGGVTWRSQLSRVRAVGFSGTGNQLTDIEYLSPDTGVCTGLGGAIAITHSGGLNWSRKPIITRRGLRAVKWLDSDRLIAVGDSGTVLRSENGGEQWTFQDLPTNRPLLELWMYEDDITGYAMADSLLFFTSDAGLSWSTVAVPPDYYIAMDFLNPQYGVLVGLDAVQHTYDGGATWAESFVIENVGSPRAVDIVNDTLTFLGAANMLRSINSSLNFDSVSTSASLFIDEIEMIDDTLGWFLASPNPRFTMDGGRSWFNISTSCLNNSFGFDAIDVLDAEHVYIAGAASSSKMWAGERSTVTKVQDSVMCLGEKFNLTYRFKGQRWFGENTFIAQLSDAQGSFDAPFTLGTYVNDSRNIDPSGVISCLLPSGIAEGDGYRIRVIMQEVEVEAQDNGFDISLTTALEPSVSLMQIGGICLGEAIEFLTSQEQAGSMQTYTWLINGELIPHTGVSFQSDTLEAGDQVQVNMSMESTCTSTMVSTELLTVPEPVIAQLELSPDSTIFQGMSVQLFAQGGLQYLWEPPTFLDTSDIPNPTATPDTTITYVVTMTDANGCMDTDSVTITVEPIVDGVQEIEGELRFWPNPTDGILHISRMKSAVMPWEMFDLSGRPVAQGLLVGFSSTIDLTGLSVGLYLFKAGIQTYRIAYQR